MKNKYKKDYQDLKNDGESVSSDLLNEAMQRDEFEYKSVNPNYKITLNSPKIIILDTKYPPKNPDSYLAFSLKYTKNVSNNFIKQVQKFDSKLLGIKKKRGILL